MKKYCVLLSLLLLLTGCGKQAPVNRPHTLLVTCGESSVYAKTSGYSWNWKDGRQTESALADMEDPRALLGELPYLNANGQPQLELEFAQMPQQVSVTRWSSADNYATDETVELSDLKLEAPQDENSYLYSILATWSEGGKNWGECVYNFSYLPQGMVVSQGSSDVSFTEVAGDLSLEEVLSLKASDLFGVEIRTQRGEGQAKTCRNLKDKTAVLDFLQANLSADMMPVEAAPAAQHMMRLACVDGRQVTVGFGEAGGTTLVLVGDLVYEGKPMEFDGLWEQLGAAAISQEAADMGNGVLAAADELPIDHWDADIVYGYVRGLEDALIMDEVRLIEDAQAEDGYRLEPGWKNQKKAVAEDCEFWLWDQQNDSYVQITKDSFARKTVNVGYDILMRFYVQDDAVIAVCQQVLP